MGNLEPRTDIVVEDVEDRGMGYVIPQPHRMPGLFNLETILGSNLGKNLWNWLIQCRRRISFKNWLHA